ncbi:MAG: glycosyltransferase family 39 protein, partial [Planctomycetota bacterium]|nr:glycosyltransferase family 39 protein [Planctomycetota bacterium]
MRSLFTPGLVMALAVYVLFRTLLLYTAFDETVMPQYELYPMGTIPELLSGAGHIPLQFHYDNAAGQLFTGVAAWPLYALFGKSYLALKLVPALLGVGGLIFLHFFLRENFSSRAANIGALFFALGPVPTMMKYSVFAGGNHFEHIPFAIFTLWCFYRLHREHGGSDRRWLFFTGLAMGFQLFILLGALIPILLLCFVHLGLRGIRGAVKDLAALAPGALIGASPLLLINLATRGRSGDFVGSTISKEGPGFFDRALEFAVQRIDN